MRQRLIVERQCKDDVASDLSRVKLAVKSPKLYRMVAGKKAVEVQKVIPAAVVVCAAVIVVTRIPDVLDLRHGLGLSAVHLLDQRRIHLLAKPHPVRLDLQGLVEKVVFARYDVHEVPKAPWRMVRAVQVDVYSRAAVREAARFSEFAHQFLQGVDILAVCEDRADHLDAVFVPGVDDPPAFLLLCADAAVAHELPNPTVPRYNLLRVIEIASAFHPAAQKLCRHLGRLRSCDPRELNLDTEFFCEHPCFLPFKSVFSVSVGHIRPLETQESKAILLEF